MLLLRNRFLLFYLLLYAVLLFLMACYEPFPIGEPLAILGIIGIGFSALAWQATRGVLPLSTAVRNPGRESVLLLAYLPVMAVFLVWGLSYVHASVTTEPWKLLAVTLAKLAVSVALPYALLAGLWRYTPQEIAPVSLRASHLRAALVVAAALLVFQVVLGQGPASIRESGLHGWALAFALPLASLWLLVEVGLVEEFFFRAVLQTRAAALLKSEVSGIVIASLLFGLVHAPGYYFRGAGTMEGIGAQPSWLMAIGYSVVVTSVSGFFLGVLWARTRNLATVMLVHAAGDLVPNLVPIARAWGLI